MVGNVFKKLDIYTVLLILILFTIGMLAIASATKVYAGNYGHMKMQLIAFGLSTVILLCMLNFDYTIFKNIAPGLYVLLVIPLLLLVAVPSVGYSTYGATRWFKIGPVQIQFSEFAKIFFILTFAAHIDKIQEEDKSKINKLQKLGMLFLHAAIPVALIMKQPDNGTALVFCVIVAAMLFTAGLDIRYFIAAISSGIVALPAFYFLILPKLPEYVQNRIFVFLDPNHDPLGAGYNVYMSKLSIGSGRIFGQGLFNGLQIQTNALPVKESDFIFSVIGQELGFVCCVLVIITYLLLFIRFVYLSRRSKDNYGTLIIIGVTAMMFFHVYQNIGMNVGIMPVSGIPLPLISYGGSAVLTNMAGIGLVLNAGMSGKRFMHNKVKVIENVKKVPYSKE